MNLFPIVTPEDHERALARIAALASAATETPEAHERKALVALVYDYEAPARAELAALLADHESDPVDFLLEVLEERGLTRKDLEAYLGSRFKVSEVLARKRALSLEMIRKLHAGLKLPLEVLVRPFRKPKEARKRAISSAAPRTRRSGRAA